MTLRRIALGYAATPPLPVALWAVSLWRDHADQGVAALGGIFLKLLPGAYLAMAVVGVPAFLLAGRLGGWAQHIIIGMLAVWFVEFAYLTVVGLSDGGLPVSDLPSVFAVIAADAAGQWLSALLLPAMFGALAGLIFWALTRTRPELFQGRFG